MTEPLVKQIVDLKEEHTLMLEAMKKALKWIDGYVPEEDCQLYCMAIKAAVLGNERRKAVGNVDLPDKRGMKDGTT